ncbi:MAG TPA: hypothetical protein VIM48_09515, partial [Chthoniobacterales bacterium]
PFMRATVESAKGIEKVTTIVEGVAQPQFDLPLWPAQSEWESSYSITSDGRLFASELFIHWKPWIYQSLADAGKIPEIETAWLFEKFTGLPRNLYPSREGIVSDEALEHNASISVQGDKELEERLQKSSGPR